MKRRESRLRAPLQLIFASGLLALSTRCNNRFDFNVPDAASSGDSGTSGSSGMGGRPGCVQDADCGLASLHCDAASGLCVECLADAQCAERGLARCDAATHRCVECGLDLDCPVEAACDPSSRRCELRCREDQDCLGDEPACDSVQGTCFECRDDDECERSSAGPHCLSESGRCAECKLDADCGALLCDTVSGACVECRSSSDCRAPEVCDPDDHLCRAL